jgi:hypothetical protein
MSDTKIARRRLTEVPVGTILPHYDFDGLLTFDTDIYMYCDGSVVADPDSPLNTHTLPDMSNRYLVGFGTEAGRDIDAAAWPGGAETPDWTVIGNANHQVALVAHSHALTGSSQANTVTVFGTTWSNHTHTAPSPTHSGGLLTARLSGNNPDTGNIIRVSARTSSVNNWYYNRHIGSTDQWSTSSSATAQTQGVIVAGSTGSASGGSTGTPSTTLTFDSHVHGVGLYQILAGGTGAATQNVQPRSLRVRFIIRVK